MDRQVGVQPLAAVLSDVVERPVAVPGDEVRLFDDLQLSSTTMLEMLMVLKNPIGLVDHPEEDAGEFLAVGSLTHLVGPALRTQVST